MTQRTRVTTRVLHLDPHLAWPTAIFTTIAPKIATPAVAPKVSAESTNGLVIHQWTATTKKMFGGLTIELCFYCFCCCC